MHQEITSPSPSSRNFFHVPKSFHRTGGPHCFCQDSEFSVQFSRQCRFLQNRGVNLASACIGALLTAPTSYPVRRTVVWTGASVGGDVSRQRRRLPQWQNHPWRLTGASTAIRRRSAPPTPPGASTWPSFPPLRAAEPSPWPERRRACSLPPTSPVRRSVGNVE